MAEDLLNAEFSILDLVFGTADQVLLLLFDWMVGFCESKDEIINFLTKQGSGNSSSSFDEIGLDLRQLDALVGMVSGMGSINGICDNLLDARNGDGEGDMLDLATNVRESAMSIVTNVARCEKFLDSENIWWRNADDEESTDSEILEQIFLLTGFEDGGELCDALVYYMTQEPVGECGFCLMKQFQLYYFIQTVSEKNWTMGFSSLGKKWKSNQSEKSEKVKFVPYKKRNPGDENPNVQFFLTQSVVCYI